jgi:hypothetical protein
MEALALMENAIYKESWEANRRLNELGLTREQLIEVVKASVAGRGDCTENDPPSAPGWTSWCYGVRRLRQIFRREGWDKDDTGQLSTIANHELRIKIAVCNTDDGTAIEDRIPRNRSRKGVISERATDINAKPYLFPEMEEDARRNTSGYVTWYLCIYIEGDRVRAELSCPSAFAAGYFTSYIERIFILNEDDWKNLDFSQQGEDSGPDIEVNVRRK